MKVHNLFIISTLLLFFHSCSQANNSQPAKAKGVDVGWLSEMEHDNIVFYNDAGKPQDCLTILKKLGMNAVRLRVWVNPPDGWSGKADVVAMSKKINKLGLQLMIDFHYSDFFADPGKQDKPQQWADYSLDELCQAVAEHTTDVLQALKDQHIEPQWIQIGNETRNGMLWDTGKFWDTDGNELPNGWNNFVRLCNHGYDAAKSIFPNAKVGVHVDNAFSDNTWWWQKYQDLGGKFDIIYLSHYPQTQPTISWEEMNSLCAENCVRLAAQFNCQTMISEVGMYANDTLNTTIMQDFADKVLSLPVCDGAFYWEPEVYGGWHPAIYNDLGWGSYNMGAFTPEGQPNEALKILLK